MAEITKVVFDIKGKEYMFTYSAAKELYHEMETIFKNRTDPPSVDITSRSWPLKDDFISFGGTMDTDTISVSNYDYTAPTAAPKKYCKCS